MYHWAPFVTGLIISEIPYLILCGVLYFVCFYYTAGFPAASTRAGSVLFVMIVYEFIYTGIGQFVAAYAPNAVFASLINPLLLGTLVSFCGVLVPYAQIQVSEISKSARPINVLNHIQIGSDTANPSSLRFLGVLALLALLSVSVVLRNNLQGGSSS